MRKGNIKFLLKIFLCSKKLVDLTLRVYYVYDHQTVYDISNVVYFYNCMNVAYTFLNHFYCMILGTDHPQLLNNINLFLKHNIPIIIIARMMTSPPATTPNIIGKGESARIHRTLYYVVIRHI